MKGIKNCCKKQRNRNRQNGLTRRNNEDRIMVREYQNQSYISVDVLGVLYFIVYCSVTKLFKQTIIAQGNIKFMLSFCTESRRGLSTLPSTIV